jgi:hypothetical protein
VTTDSIQEHFESDAVVQIFAGVYLEAQVNARVSESVQDRTPAGRQFVEGSLDESGRPLRPWV